MAFRTHTPDGSSKMRRKASGRTAEVMEAIRRKLAARVLTPGERLPSIRRFAASMQVSPSTVVEAYDRLAAEGLNSCAAGFRILRIRRGAATRARRGGASP